MSYVPGHEWTLDDKRRLTELAGAGHADEDMAVILGRPVRSVSAQRMLLGIKPNRKA